MTSKILGAVEFYLVLAKQFFNFLSTKEIIVSDRSWGWPEGSLFDSYYTQV